MAKLTHEHKCWGGRPFDVDEALGYYEKAKEYGAKSLPVGGGEGWGGFMSVGLHQGVLLGNAGRIDEADACFRGVLYRAQHDVGVKSCEGWLVYGGFLENCRGDLQGARGCYERAKEIADRGGSGEGGKDAVLALAQLFELQLGDCGKGKEVLQGGLSRWGLEGGKENCKLLVTAAQYSSEVDGDVVSAMHLLGKCLDADPGYGPALRWQGLLLARGGQIEAGLEKLIASGEWRGGGGKKVYCAGVRAAALTGLAWAVECDAGVARRGGGRGLLEGSTKWCLRTRGLLARCDLAEPRCRWTNLCNGLLQLGYVRERSEHISFARACPSLQRSHTLLLELAFFPSHLTLAHARFARRYFGNAKKAEAFLTAATHMHSGGEKPGVGRVPHGYLHDVVPAEAFRTLARLMDVTGNKLGAVGVWKRCMVCHPGDRLAMAGLATTLWGISKGWGGEEGGEKELTEMGLGLWKEWRGDLVNECLKLFLASVRVTGWVEGGELGMMEKEKEERGKWPGDLWCEGAVPPECHSLFGAFLQVRRAKRNELCVLVP